MTEPISTPELLPSSRQLSRREFLKILAIALSAGAAVHEGMDRPAARLTETFPQKDDSPIPSEVLTEEQTRLLNEVIEYREALALRGLPAHLAPLKLREASRILWDQNVSETKVNIPDAHKSHATQALRIQKILFGDNGNRLVSAIKSDESVTSSGTFSDKTRIMSLDTIDDPTSPWFVFVSTHEYTHATDPSLAVVDSIYPLDKLIEISHGMARILNQSVKIKEIFLNNPDSYNIPFIKKGIGEGVGRLFLRDHALIDQVDFAGHNLVIDTLAPIAKEQGTTIAGLKFTKKTCLKLGEALLPRILNKDISISGSLLNDWYSPRIEAATKEVFADMVATSLMTPEKVGYNSEILAGITEILTSIQGKTVDINEVIKRLHTTDDDIKDRFVAEQEAIAQNTQPDSQSDASLLEITEVQAIQKEAVEEERKQDTLWRFIMTGEVPPDIGKDSEDIKTTMDKYGQVIAATYRQFPEIIYGLYVDDLSFDPNLHIWETWTVAEAWNVNVFYNLLTDPSLIPENLKDVKRRIKVLENFINSPEFIRDRGQSSETPQSRPVSHAEAVRERIKSVL